MAREIANLSLIVRNGKHRNEGAVCSGAGRGEARHHARSSARLHKGHFIEPADFVFYANAPVELDKVRADAEKDVLAIVHNFVCSGMLIRRCAAAEIGTPLENCHPESAIRQRTCCRKTRETAARDGYSGICRGGIHSGQLIADR